MDINTKSGTFMAEIKSTTATTKAPSGSFEAVLSMPTVDRDKEIVDAAAFAPLPDHITIDIDHAMTVEKTVGSGRPFYDGSVLKFEGTYASHPLAQMVRSLVDEGHIKTMSVAYMNSYYEVDENDGLLHMRKAELLNAGIVGIPSNREALITASKSLAATVSEVTEPETKAHDPALLQSAHDALVALGVKCSEGHHSDLASAGDDVTPTNPETTAAAKAAVTSPAAVDVAAMTRNARIGAALTASALISAPPQNPTLP